MVHFLAECGDAAVARVCNEHERRGVQQGREVVEARPVRAAQGRPERLAATRRRLRRAEEHERRQRHERHRHDQHVRPACPANPREDRHGQEHDGRERHGHKPRLCIDPERVQQVPRETERRRRRRSALGAEKHPACGEAKLRAEQAVAVLIRPAADRMVGRKLGAAQGVARGEGGRQRDGDDDSRPGDARGDADRHEDARADN